MQACNAQIPTFMLSGKIVFVVPVYQRNYSWQKEHCWKLFNDIVQVVATGKEHFLGTICFKGNSIWECAVIDGQQRLTSISLLLKAIYDLDSREEVRDEVKRYLYNSGLGVNTELQKFKLHLNKRDDAVYHILLNNTFDTMEQSLSASQRNCRVYQNYLHFYKFVSDYIASGGKTEDLINAFSYLTLVELEIQDENPQEIFESLNSTGLDLTDVDLLRNYFLMQFSYEQQTDLYEKYWSRIEDLIGGSMPQFFIDYMIFRKRSDAVMLNGRRAHMTEGKLYTLFKDYFRDYMPDLDPYEKTEKLFADMLYCAGLYRQFLFKDDVNLASESPLRQKLYYMLALSDSKSADSLLLYVFDLKERGKIDADALNAAVDAVSSMMFRAKICRANGISRQFAGNVMLRLDEISDYSKFMDVFWQAITVGKGSFAFPSDRDFMDALVNKDLYKMLRSRGMKYLLYILEMHSPFPKGLPPVTDDSITIEHIMPQTLTAEWKSYLTKTTMENFEFLLHRLGNLALTNYNGEMSNRNFADKCTIYEESSFYYTRHITDHAQWQMSDIDDRSMALAEEALKIWPLPTAYHKPDKASSKSLHMLDEETSKFSYTKPDLLLIGDKEYAVGHWSEVLPILCHHLDREDHESFLELAESGQFSCFGVEDDEHDYSSNVAFTHIVESVYVRQQMSAAAVINNMGKISSAFDTISGTEHRKNIMFAIK